MDYKNLSWIFLSLMLLTFQTGCGGSAGQEAEAQEEVAKAAESMEDAATQMEEAATKMGEAVQKMNKGEKVEVVDFRKLKEMLPEKLSGLDRKSSEGEKAGGFGMNFSTARASYAGSNNQSIEVNIADTGGMGMALMGMAAWSQVEMDRESEEGYERTTTIDGFKAFEKYNSKSQSGETSMIVDNRFVVTVEGRNVTEKELKKAIGQLNVQRLSALQ